MGRGGTLALWPPYLYRFPSVTSGDRRCKVDHQLEANSLLRAVVCLRPSLTVVLFRFPSPTEGRKPLQKAFGQLVLLGFAIADFTPAAYLRHRL